MVHLRKKELPRSSGYWHASVSHGMLDKGPPFFHWLLATLSCLPNMSLQHGSMLHQDTQATGIRDSLSVRWRPWAFIDEVQKWHSVTFAISLS